MQFFGKYDTRFDREFLTESYLYFNEDDQELSPSEFEKLIKSKKDKKKNIVGTIFMYSPFYYPYGYDEKKKLLSSNNSGYRFIQTYNLYEISFRITMCFRNC